MSRLGWDAATATCVVLDATHLEEFRWAPPATGLATLTEPSAKVTAALAQVASSPDGVNFARLIRDPDYRARFDAGYREGFSEGQSVTVKKWADDYLSVLVVLFSGLLAAATTINRVPDELFRVSVMTWFASPSGKVAPVEDPLFADLVARLRGRQVNAGDAAPAVDDEDEDPDVAAADLLEAAAYADGLARAARSVQSRGILGRLRLGYQDWLDELRADAVPLWQDIVGLNCQPEAQGQLAGAWEGSTLVSTYRSVLETVLKLAGSHPELLLTTVPGLGELPSLVLDQVLAVTGDDEDD